MAVRAIIGFEHLPQGSTSWINYATHGMTRGADLSAQNTIVNGWLVSNATSSGAERVSIPLDAYLVAPVAKIWFGYRCRVIKNARGGAGIVYLGASYVLLDGSVPVTGNTCYIEMSYEVATGTVERWIDGVQIANSAAGATRSLLLGLEAKGSLNGQYDYRDFYICDDQGAAQGKPVGRLGPQIVAPITFDAASGSDWTTTPGGTLLLDAINEPGAVPTNKIATSNVTTKGPLVASMKSNIAAGTIVTAIEIVAGLSSASGAPVTCATKVNAGGVDVNGLPLTGPTSTYNYNGTAGVFHKAPSGLGWDSASIDAADFILSPDA